MIFCNPFKKRKLIAAKQTERAALERAQKAQSRKDTRSIHATRKALREATHAALKAELRNG